MFVRFVPVMSMQIPLTKMDDLEPETESVGTVESNIVGKLLTLIYT